METAKEVLTTITNFLKDFGYFFSTKLFSLGASDITLGNLTYLVFSIVALIYISNRLSRFISTSVLKRYATTASTANTISTIVKYIIISVGLIIIIQTAGIDLSTLSILAGALGVGIGFGLQNITNNFISGVIILFEQPIKVGDRIDVANVTGDVTRISARATTVLTNDNISVIVPNSEFISSTVINWSHNDRNVSFRFPVGVAYKEDPVVIKKLLLEVAKEHEGILSHPESQVLFDEFGDSSLNFFLRVWTSEYTSRPNILKSELYYSIFEKFKKNGIEIPFPQRDLHLKSNFKPISDG